MNHQEKKYRVESFDDVLKILRAKDSQKIHEVSSIHYYGVHEGNDVEKFVVYPDRTEIHSLKESDGKYILTDHRTITNKEEGLQWLKDQGYKRTNIVRMEYEEYGYRDGIVGLYTIDNFLHSIILDFLPDQHGDIEKEFGLTGTEVITVAYNKYLGMLGRIRSMELN